MEYDQILPKLYVGSHPADREDIDRLQAESSITAVLNLQTDEDLAWWRRDWSALAAHYGARGIEVRRVPIRDGDTEDLADKLPQAVNVLDQLLREGHTVYAHCTAGAWRSPTVVVAYLHWCCGWDLDAAISLVRQRRGCTPSLEAIQWATKDLLRQEAMGRHE